MGGTAVGAPSAVFAEEVCGAEASGEGTGVISDKITHGSSLAEDDDERK